MISSPYVDGLELRIRELEAEVRRLKCEQGFHAWQPEDRSYHYACDKCAWCGEIKWIK
jgi:hypothetical protein